MPLESEVMELVYDVAFVALVKAILTGTKADPDDVAAVAD